jgi:hypothetical protein
VEWAKNIGVFGLFNMQRNPIQLLVKKFLQAITHFNLDINESVV